MTDALKDEFPDPETELAFLDFLATEWPNWRHHVGSDYWHIRRRSFLAGRSAPQALAATPAVGGEAVAWQWRVNYDKGSARENEWCSWHDTSEKYYNSICAEIAKGRDRVQVRALYAAQPASPLRGREPTDEQIEIACAAYAKATGYYVEFHRGLSSASSDEMRKGMRAALSASPPGQPAALPLAVRLRDEAGPPLPQMVAQRRAQLSQEQPAADPNKQPLIEPFTGNYKGTKE